MQLSRKSEGTQVLGLTIENRVNNPDILLLNAQDTEMNGSVVEMIATTVIEMIDSEMADTATNTVEKTQTATKTVEKTETAIKTVENTETVTKTVEKTETVLGTVTTATTKTGIIGTTGIGTTGIIGTAIGTIIVVTIGIMTTAAAMTFAEMIVMTPPMMTAVVAIAKTGMEETAGERSARGRIVGGKTAGEKKIAIAMTVDEKKVGGKATTVDAIVEKRTTIMTWKDIHRHAVMERKTPRKCQSQCRCRLRTSGTLTMMKNYTAETLDDIRKEIILVTTVLRPL
ncbi:hypothetical protein L208DRAFT_77331 [Tricholoma matsutake]|nr:hypothetical protein L208DRAFT_77331 [Tricholoma matsutake 945]